MIDVDRIICKFMLLTIIGSITGFIWFGFGIAPLIVVWLIGGMLLVVGGCWIMQDVQNGSLK